MYTLAKIINFVLNNRWNMFFSLNIIVLFFYLFTKDSIFGLLLEFLVLLLVLTTKRVSDVLVFNYLFKIASMNLKDVHMFSKYNYETDKQIISNIFQKELIQGFLNLNVKKIKFESHQWVLNCLLNDKQINEKYIIQFKRIGTNTHILDVLLFSNGEKINIHPRIEYKIILIKK